MKKHLAEMKRDFLIDVRGRGLFIAMETDPNSSVKAKDLALAMMKQGVLAKQSHTYNLRLSPPLIVNQQQCDEILEKTQKAINSL